MYLNNETNLASHPILHNYSLYIENNTWVRGNTKFISSVEYDISRVSAANE